MKTARLLKYRYRYYCQGTEEEAQEYVLVYAPIDASFENVRSILMNEKYRSDDHEIFIDSVEEMTII